MAVATMATSPAAADAGLIAACQRGDREAFRRLFEKYKDRVYSLALHFSGNEAVAQDVAQRIFLKLYTSIGQFRGDSHFTTWLYRMVFNACTDEQRKTRRLVPLEGGAVTAAERRSPAASRPQEQAQFRRQISDAVRSALQNLKPELRQPLVLRYVEGLSYQEIATAMGCSSGTVASRLNRGHKLLARQLAHLRGQLSR
ncbi:MAG: sigma-70 family RNA polymerase sigma factor [Candidatus Acidiferrales bacterium]